MGKPISLILGQHSCDVPDASGTHLELPFFIPGTSTVKVYGLPVACQGDLSICLNRVPTPAGPVPVPMPNSIQRGSGTVKFDGKNVARKGDPMQHGGQITQGIGTVSIGD